MKLYQKTAAAVVVLSGFLATNFSISAAEPPELTHTQKHIVDRYLPVIDCMGNLEDARNVPPVIEYDMDEADRLEASGISRREVNGIILSRELVKFVDVEINPDYIEYLKGMEFSQDEINILIVNQQISSDTARCLDQENRTQDDMNAYRKLDEENSLSVMKYRFPELHFSQ